MRDQVARTLRDCYLQLLLSLHKPLAFHQRPPQQRMDAGLKIKQAERFTGGDDRLFEMTGLEMERGELRKQESILRIGLKHLLKQNAGSVRISQLSKRACDTLLQRIA